MLEVLKMPKVKLGDIAKERREVYKGDKSSCPVVGLEHLTPGEIRLSAWDVGGDNTFSKAFFAGDVLFGRRRAYLKKAAQATVDGLCSGDITVIQARADRVSPDLLPFIIQNDAFFEFAVENSAGSLSPRVKWEHLANYEIDLPSMDEQRKLASLLWAAYELKESYTRLLRASDEMAKSRFIEMFGHFPENEKRWLTGTIRDVVSEVRYGSSRPASQGGQYPYLRMNNITYEGELDLTDVKTIDIPEGELPKCTVRRGDVLFNRTNSKELVGKTCVYNRDEMMVLAGFVIRVRLKEELMLPEFLSTFLNTDFSKQMLLNLCKTAIGQANINAQELQNIGIYLPPIDAQRSFVAFKQQLDKSKVELQKSIDAIEAIIKSLLGEVI